jgi:hypothetical protein
MIRSHIIESVNTTAVKYNVILASVTLVLSIWFAHGSTIAEKFSEPHWEDTIFFQHNEVEVESIAQCLKPNTLLPGLYRPLSTTCYFFLGRQLIQNSPEGYHAINLIFVFLNGLLLFLIAQSFIPKRWSLLAAVLFVSRYAHTEVITNTVEFQVLSSSFFSFLGIYLFLRLHNKIRLFSLSALLLGFVLCAILCKETAVVVPILLATYLFFIKKQNHPKIYFLLLSVPILWAILYLGFYKSFISASPTGFNYTLSPIHILLQSSGHFADFSNLLVGGQKHTPFSENVLHLIELPAFSVFFFLLLISMFGLLVFSLKLNPNTHQSFRLLAFCFFAWFVSTSPFFILDDRLFMRYSYFGHAWLAIFWAILLQIIIAKVRFYFFAPTVASSQAETERSH